MADPFQDVDQAGPEFIKLFADSMDVRQSDPTMESIVADYLGALEIAAGGLVVEVGAGAGAVTRRIAAHLSPATVIGYEPSQGFVDEARARANGIDNLSFEKADGADLPLADGQADALIMHTVLTHVVAPGDLIAEAFRVLKPGGTLVICDADFSKATFSAFPNDPLDVCAREFVRVFVTDAFLVGKLRGLVQEAGFVLNAFSVRSRVVTTPEQMLPWVEMTVRGMVDAGSIGQDLADALVAEHARRADLGTLYGYQAFATAIGKKAT